MVTKEKPKVPPKPTPAAEAKPEAKPDPKKGKNDLSVPVAQSNVPQNIKDNKEKQQKVNLDTSQEPTPKPSKVLGKKKSDPKCNQIFCTCNDKPSNLRTIGGMINGPKYTCGCGGCAECDDDIIDVSPSQDNLCPNDTPDNRLQTWLDEISVRSCIAKKLMQRTGKCCHELLFNRTSTVNERDKVMVQRMLAHADRMKPMTRRTYKRQTFNECIDGVCEYVLLAAMPTHERHVEISGLSKMTKEEVLGENYITKGSQWMKSEVLAQRLKTKGKDIKRVLQFFPDIDNLFVVGTAATIHPAPASATASISAPPKSKNQSKKGNAISKKSKLSVASSENAESTDTEPIILNTCDKIKILAKCLVANHLNNSRGEIQGKKSKNVMKKMRQPRAVNISNGTENKITFA